MPTPQQALLAFYRDGGPDNQGRNLDEILEWSDADLEKVHDFIQWLFPLSERSGVNPSAPILSGDLIAAFRATPKMQENLRRSYRRMLHFYSLDSESAAHPHQIAESVAQKHAHWLSPGNHNHLRLTRILRSLCVLGLEKEAEELWHLLSAIHRAAPHAVSATTFTFWQRAAVTPLNDF